MRNLKRKKRLTTLAVAFLMTFVVGSAFALSSGMLDITGAVNIHVPTGYVVWSNVDIGSDFGPGGSGIIAPFNGSLYAQQDVEIVSRPGGEDEQRIDWTVAFYGVEPVSGLAYAELTATLTNMNAVIDAEITAVRLILDPADATDFGLSLDFGEFSTPIAVGDVIAAGDSVTTSFELVWDGTIPPAFTSDNDLASGDLGYALATNVTIEIEYDPV